MRELSLAELDLISGGNGIGFCRRLTRWEAAKVGFARLFFPEEAAELARAYSYS